MGVRRRLDRLRRAGVAPEAFTEVVTLHVQPGGELHSPWCPSSLTSPGTPVRKVVAELTELPTCCLDLVLASSPRLQAARRGAAQLHQAERWAAKPSTTGNGATYQQACLHHAAAQALQGRADLPDVTPLLELLESRRDTAWQWLVGAREALQARADRWLERSRRAPESQLGGLGVAVLQPGRSTGDLRDVVVLFQAAQVEDTSVLVGPIRVLRWAAAETLHGAVAVVPDEAAIEVTLTLLQDARHAAEPWQAVLERAVELAVMTTRATGATPSAAGLPVTTVLPEPTQEEKR